MERKEKANELTETQLRSMYLAMPDAKKQHGSKSTYDWKRILHISGLAEQGFSSSQLREKYQNFRKRYKISNIFEYENHLRPKQLSGASQHIGELSGQNVGDGQSSEADPDHGQADRARPLGRFGDLTSPTRVEASMRADFEIVSKIVSGPVLGSFSLYMYLGGNRLVSYRRFQELARQMSPKFSRSITFEFDMPIKFAMAKLEAELGNPFDRERFSNLATEQTTETSLAEPCSIPDRQPTGSDHLVGEDVLAMKKTLNIIIDQLDVPEVIDITGQEDTSATHCSPVVSSPQKQSSPLYEGPLSATPKRGRFDLGLEYSVREEPRRTWKDDPLPQGFPSGFGAMHRMRMLTDVEWTKVLAYDSYARLLKKTPVEWENLLRRLRIWTAKTGEEIKGDFYARVVPRIREEVFGKDGTNVQHELQLPDCYTLTTLYHSVKERTKQGIEVAVQFLLDSAIISGSMNEPCLFWSDALWEHLITRDNVFFHTTQQDFNAFKKSVFGEY